MGKEQLEAEKKVQAEPVQAEPIQAEREEEAAFTPFSADFLERQRSASPVSAQQMTDLHRVTFALPLYAEIKEEAPMPEEELKKLSWRQRKRLKKARNKKIKENQELKDSQQKKDQESMGRTQQEHVTVEGMIQDKDVQDYARQEGQEKRLDPNQYVGGEDDIINATILREMSENPLAWGLAQKDSPAAAGFTVENMEALRQLNEQVRYSKWRYRFACDILSPYYANKSSDPNLSPEQLAQAEKQSQFLETYRENAERQIQLMDRTVSTALANLINHKNIVIPASSQAHVKKRNYNIPVYAGIQEYYRQALKEEELYHTFDKLRQDVAPGMAMKKELRDQGYALAQSMNLSAEALKEVQDGAFDEESVRIYADMLQKYPEPQDAAQKEAYRKEMGQFIQNLRGYSSVRAAKAGKQLIEKNHPEIFEDHEGRAYKRQQELLQGEQVLADGYYADIQASLQKLSAITAPPSK